MSADSVYDDGRGNSWHIGKLLTSSRPRGLRLVDVELLLTPLLDTIRWEQDSGTPRDIRELCLEEVGRGRIPRAQRGHVDHVMLVVGQLRSHIEPTPLVIGMDGGLWDGLHRLIAYSLAGRKQCYAVDFSDTCDNRLLPYSICALEGEVSSVWLDRCELARRQGQFLTKDYFHRLILDDFLCCEIARQCFVDLTKIGDGWERVETDLYSQDEYILEANDEALSVALRRLVLMLQSGSLLTWIARCTGRVIKGGPSIVAHRMRPGDYVGIHDDYRLGGEVIRFVLFLGSGFLEEGKRCSCYVRGGGG